MATSENPPNATLYVKNLNENVKLPFLIEQLREIFGEFGDIIDIVAKKNYWARGQAFIVYSSAEEAADALEALNDFELLEKPMVVAYAKSKSDEIVKREEDEAGFEEHKKQRLAEKERKQPERWARATRNNPTVKRTAPDESADQRPAKAAKPIGSTAGAAMADELLPPNKTLVLRDLPEDYTQEQLTAIFKRYAGFQAVSLVPGRKGIGFAYYEDENAAQTPKEELNGLQLGEKSIKVTYQKPG